MSYTMKNQSGSLFKNDRKEKENQPDYKGKCLIDGEEKEIAAWIKTGKSGVKYMSLSFGEIRRKDEAQEVNQTPDANSFPSVGDNDFSNPDDDSIPFGLIFAFIGLAFYLALFGQITA